MQWSDGRERAVDRDGPLRDAPTTAPDAALRASAIRARECICRMALARWSNGLETGSTKEVDDMPATTTTTGPRTEEFRLTGEELIAKIKELVNEGNIRRIVIKNEEGSTLIEVPVTLGVIGALLLPVWAAIGALAAVATNCAIVVERRDA